MGIPNLMFPEIRNVHWMVLYQICIFGADLKSNMAARVHNVFSLAEILKIFLSFLTRRFLKFQPIRTHYGPWQPCWISNQRRKQISCIWPSNEHFCQVWFKSVLRTDFNQTCQKRSLDGPLPDLYFWCWFEIQHGCQGP
jgi:hypothetical protein